MSMNNLNEQVNKRVIFENDDYGIYLPYNLSSICSLVPNWCEDKKMKDRTLESFKQKGVLYLVNSKKDKIWYILQDEGSSIPLQKSGKYKMYQPQMSGYVYGDQTNVKKYFSQSKELIDALNLDYTVNEMLKYGIPFTPEEMKEYSEKTPFAKVIYEIIMKKRGKFALEKFTGRDDIEIVEDALSPYEDIDNGSVAIHPRHDGVTFYMEDEYFKEKVLNLTDDDSWAYNTAMGNGYDDCEEMDAEELNYLGNYLNEETRDGFNSLREVMGFEPIQTFTNDEGEIVEFLEKYFPGEADRMANDWLHSLGCSIGRGRAKSIREYISDEVLFEYEESGSMTEMFIPWSSLLRLVGKNKLESFEGIVDLEINDIGELHDMWYDSWEVDDEGEAEMNYDFNYMLEKIKDERLDNITNIKANIEKFDEKVIKSFGFIPESNYRNTPYAYKLKNPIPHPQGPLRVDGDVHIGGEPKMVHIVEFDTEEGEITLYQGNYGYHTRKNRFTMTIDKFIEYMNNLKNNPELPFPELTNEQYTNQIINNIINKVIQENTQTKQK